MDQAQILQKVSTFDIASYPHKDDVLRIAKSIVETSARVKKDQKVLIYFDDPGLPLVHAIYNECLRIGANISFFLRDYALVAKEISALSLDEIEHYCDGEKEVVETSENIIIIRCPANPEILETVAPEKRALYMKQSLNAHEYRTAGKVEWLLFYWPTEREAAVEGVSFEQYFQEVLDACDMNWEEVATVQQKLVNILNNGKKLTLIANADNPDPRKRTEVSMSIEGMTFINSTVYKNYPGSEVYSAPVKDSVNGQIFAEGKYQYGGHLMEDIYFKIEQGKIVEAEAKINNEGLQEILSEGEGARYFGEVAFGTNPKLKRRFFNPLLNEKVGGSFHMAIGHCYTFTQDMGIPVKVNNGNTSDLTPIHWDVAILMHKNGKVIVDDLVIQENGRFLDPDLALLNR